MQSEYENSILFSNNESGPDYGAIKSDISSTNNSVRKIIYCVHGKPSAGCCTVLGGEVIEIDNGQNMTVTQQENIDVTDLINRHCHRSQNTGVDKTARKKLIIASILCVLFMIGEIIGGYLSNSLAIASDAAHLLTDFASFMISLFALWMASRPSTTKMHFGWYRAEVIGALTSVLLIWVITGILVYLAAERIIHKEFNIDAKIMLITSGIGVVVNLIMGLSLHQHHGHSHAHQKEDKTNDSRENLNVRAAFVHVIGDFLQSFGVFIAAAVIFYRPDWMIIDPICTFLFSVLVMFTTYAIIRDTLTVLMEGAPKGIDFNEIMKSLLNIEGVERVHNLRIWALSLDKIAMSAHIAIRPGVNSQNILMLARENIHDKYNFFEMTLQIEEFQEAMEDCNQCRNPV